MQTMDDGVPLAFTRYTPDGAAPAGGRPGVLVLHGLAESRRGRRGRGGVRERRLFGARVRRPRARKARRRDARRAARGRRPARARNAFAARSEVSDTIGAWGISYGGGQIWNVLAAGVPLAAAEVVETWTSLYDALCRRTWPGIVAGFAATIAARSPLVAGIRDDAVQSRNLGAVRALSADCSAAARLGSIRTPVYLFQGKVDFAFDHVQATTAFSRLAGPKKLYAQLRPCAVDLPGRGRRVNVLSQGVAWFDRHLRGKRNGVDAIKVVIAKRASATARVELDALPATRKQTFVFRDTTATARGSAPGLRRTALLQAAPETLLRHGPRHRPLKLASYPRLVVTVLAGNRVVAHGGLAPRAGVNTVRLANYCVFVPKGTRRVSPSVPPPRQARSRISASPAPDRPRSA